MSMPSLLAAGKGFTFADPYVLILSFAGLAVFVAIMALSHQHERAFSASVIYLALGLAAAAVIGLGGAKWITRSTTSRSSSTSPSSRSSSRCSRRA